MTLTRDSYRHIRSAVLQKRPLSTDILDGELAVNYHTGSVGVFLRDTLGKIRKVGPAHVGTTPPEPVNYTLLSDGELWVDRSGTTPILRYYDEAEDSWESTSIIDSSLNENQIIVGDTSDTAQAYGLDVDSFFVDHTAGVLEVRIADSPEFGSFKFASETGTGLRTSVFKVTIPVDEDDWYELEAYDKTLYRSGKYIIEITANAGQTVFITELLLCHNNTNVYYSEYGCTGSSFSPVVDFQAAIESVGGTEVVSLQAKRLPGVTGAITIRSTQTSLF